MPTIHHPRAFASASPDKPALIIADRGERISYAELTDRADRAAALFAARGIAEGDTVAFLIENHIRYPELLWAAKNSGIRYVTVSTHLNDADVAYLVEDCGAKLLVSSYALRDLACGMAARLTTQPHLLMVDGTVAPYASYEDELPDHAVGPPTARRRGPSMLYSSGTTGRPKGVRTDIPDAPPEQPPARFAMLLGQYDLGQDTVFVDPGPFYHAAPQRFMMTVQRCGGTVIAFAKFGERALLDAIDTFGATHGFFVPTMFKRLLAIPGAERATRRTDTMRHAIHGAAPCPVPVKRAMIDWWGPVIDELYAGTEAFGHSFITSAEWLAHPGSVGRPPAGCDIRIVDGEGRVLPAGVPGRIMMRNGLRIEYHGDAEKTSGLYDAEGFASLGDVGLLDADGYLYLTDRESHMIIVGGANIYPQEAEAVLAEHPAIEDVAVIGVPDDDMGEAVKAVVQLKPGTTPSDMLAAEMIAFCRGRLTLQKCPRSVDFDPDLPRNELGKLVKRKLRERYWSGQSGVI